MLKLKQLPLFCDCDLQVREIESLLRSCRVGNQIEAEER